MIKIAILFSLYLQASHGWAPIGTNRFRQRLPSSSITTVSQSVSSSSSWRRQSPPSVRLCESTSDTSSDAVPLNATTTPPRIDQTEKAVSMSTEKRQDSLRDMLRFALPALGIYLSNPMLSNIDNAFVGRTAGVAGLAALSPATICTDQVLYLFSFLSRATTGLVARAYGVVSPESTGDQSHVQAARRAASAPLTMALACGVALSAFYAFQTPALLTALQVDPAIQRQAAAYIYWRGAIAWAALAQAVALSVLMATRDAVTPLRIIGSAAVLNVIGDYALCVWPFQWGCSGAAAATSAATLMSSGFMLRGLKRKGLLPKIRMPSQKELMGLMEFTGPLVAITLTRLGGSISMQQRVMSFGVQPLAAYQLGINTMVFFLVFGEPLNQLFQTKLPAVVDTKDHVSVKATFQSVLKLAGVTSVSVAALAGLALFFGAPFFIGDIGDVVVQGLAQEVAPSLFLAVMTTIFGIAMDGAMLASRDFGFILTTGIGTFLTQLFLLQRCHTISAVFGTFTMRWSLYGFLAGTRLALGHGALGRLLRRKPEEPPVGASLMGTAVA